MKPLKVISHVVKVFDELAQKGDSISGDCLQNLRILVCNRLRSTYSRIALLTFEFIVDKVAGGDGTAGWILSTVAQVDSRFPLPVGIIPLGTGNDLSRSFGWVKFNFAFALFFSLEIFQFHSKFANFSKLFCNFRALVSLLQLWIPWDKNFWMGQWQKSQIWMGNDKEN